jgi:hypothetical protein
MRINIIFNNSLDILTSPFFASSNWEYYDTIFIASTNATEIEIAGLDDGVSSGINIDNIKLEKVTYSTLIDLKFSKFISLYPNPTKSILVIKNLMSQDYSIKIINSVGLVMIEKQIYSSEEKIDVSFLTSGVYFILISEENKIYKQKIIINK